MSIIRNLQIASKNRTTYRVGLLQAKAFRILKQETDKALKEFNITSIEWAFLGLLNDSKEGIRSCKVAEELGVEAPFVTQMVKNLKETSCIEHKIDPEDSRVKILCLSKQGRVFVENVEKHLRNDMKHVVKDISKSDLISHLSVMQGIIDSVK